MIDLTFGGILPDYALFLTAVVILSVVSAYILTTRWIVRILIGAYLSFALLLVMPDKMLFTEYAALGLFVFLTVLFAVVLGSRLISTSISWSQGSLPWLGMILSFLTIMFLLSVILLFMPSNDIPAIMSGETKKFLIDDSWFFLWSTAPITFLLIFAPRY